MIMSMYVHLMEEEYTQLYKIYNSNTDFITIIIATLYRKFVFSVVLLIYFE